MGTVLPWAAGGLWAQNKSWGVLRALQTPETTSVSSAPGPSAPAATWSSTAASTRERSPCSEFERPLGEGAGRIPGWLAKAPSLPPLSLAQVRDLRVHLSSEGLPELAPAQARRDSGHPALPL